jgi:hypothetical protein
MNNILSKANINALRSKGLTPGHFNIFDREAIALVSDIYSRDLDLFVKILV